MHWKAHLQSILRERTPQLPFTSKLLTMMNSSPPRKPYLCSGQFPAVFLHTQPWIRNFCVSSFWTMMEVRPWILFGVEYLFLIRSNLGSLHKHIIKELKELFSKHHIPSLLFFIWPAVPAPPTFRFVQTDYTAMEGESLELQVERESQIPRNYDVLLTQISLKNNPRGVVAQTVSLEGGWAYFLDQWRIVVEINQAVVTLENCSSLVQANGTYHATLYSLIRRYTYEILVFSVRCLEENRFLI